MRDDHAATAVLERTPHASAAAELQDGTVTPLNYVQLRLLAECAAGAVSQQGDTRVPVQFVFRNTPEVVGGEPVDKMELYLQEDDQSPQALDIVVPTMDDGRFPRNAVQLEIIASATPGGYSLPQPWIPDAVFWSDAAVQKFVFPYLTSCGGDEAAAVLRKLQHAWNFYPPSVEVYGLIHLASSVPGEMAMDQSFWIAFRHTGTGTGLQAVSLAEFMTIIGNERSFPLEQSPAPVPFIPGAQGSGVPLPQYSALRAMAEYAASITDQPVYFVFPASGTGGFEVYAQNAPELGSLDPADVVVPAFTPTVPSGRPVLKGVWFTPEGGEQPGNLAARGDALFWSTAAIEQFVFPYYASKGGLNKETLKDLTEIHTMWTDGATPAGEEVYALIHLPHSEWTGVITQQGVTTVDDSREFVEQDGETGVPGVGGARRPGAGKHEIKRLEPARQLGMVHLDRDGRPRALSIAHIMGRHH